MAKKVKQIGKNTLILLAIIIVVMMCYIVYKTFGNQFVELFRILEHGNQQELTAYLQQQSTFGGYFVLWLICVMQVISIFFPGMVIQIAGALIYGWWKSFLICWIGFVSGNCVAFCVGRIFKKNVRSLLKKENALIEKINQGHPVFVVAISCMIPGIPNGIIPYISAQTNISTKDYVIAVASSCWIQILLNCIAGHFLAQGEYIFMVLAFLLEILIIFLVTKNKDKLMK